MKIENEWLEKEILSIESEIRRPKYRNNQLSFLGVLAMLGAVFFCSPIDAAPARLKPNVMNKPAEGGGRVFWCQNCRTRQWQDDKNANWAGEFHCSSCGKKL